MSLRQSLYSTKIFLNMVIHDLRNPTSQICFAIKFALENLLKAQEIKDENIKLKHRKL